MSGLPEAWAREEFENPEGSRLVRRIEGAKLDGGAVGGVTPTGVVQIDLPPHRELDVDPNETLIHEIQHLRQLAFPTPGGGSLPNPFKALGHLPGILMNDYWDRPVEVGARAEAERRLKARRLRERDIELRPED